MRRQLPPSKLLVPPGPQAFPQRHFIGESTVVVNHYSGIEKTIPAIPSLPGFRTSAGMFFHCGRVTCTTIPHDISHTANGSTLIECAKRMVANGRRTAFFTSLSANLRIDPDLPSPLGTPTTFRHNSYSLQPLPPTPLSFSTLPAPHNPYPSPAEKKVMSSVEPAAPAKLATGEIPQLSTYTAESEDDRIEGLRLVADSVAQQRQVSSKMLIFHPVTLATFG